MFSIDSNPTMESLLKIFILRGSNNKLIHLED